MKTSFTFVKVITAALFTSLFLGNVEAQTKKSTSTKTAATKTTTPAPLAAKTTTATPVAASKPASSSSSSSLLSSSKAKKVAQYHKVLSEKVALCWWRSFFCRKCSSRKP